MKKEIRKENENKNCPGFLSLLEPLHNLVKIYYQKEIVLQKIRDAIRMNERHFPCWPISAPKYSLFRAIILSVPQRCEKKYSFHILACLRSHTIMSFSFPFFLIFIISLAMARYLSFWSPIVKDLSTHHTKPCHGL